MYREWVDNPNVPGLTTQQKIEAWDSDRWREKEIDLADYTQDQMEQACAAFDIMLEFLNGDLPYIQDMSDKETIQIICECLFELDY